MSISLSMVYHICVNKENGKGTLNPSDKCMHFMIRVVFQTDRWLSLKFWIYLSSSLFKLNLKNLVF